jgi:hypothetical protein
MCVLIPGMDNNYNREDFVLKSQSDSLCESWRKIEAGLKQASQSNASPTMASKVSFSNSNPQVPIIKKQSSIDWAASKGAAAKSKLSSIKRSLFQLSSHGQTSESSHSETITPGVNDNHTVGNSSSNYSSIDQNQPNGDSINHNTNTNNNNSNKPPENVVKLINKMPDWHPELKSFALDFNGRVTLSSSKNFQIVHEANTSYVVMQFGKVNRDLFTCDYSYPVNEIKIVLFEFDC